MKSSGAGERENITIPMKKLRAAEPKSRIMVVPSLGVPVAASRVYQAMSTTAFPRPAPKPSRHGAGEAADHQPAARAIP